MYTYTQTHAHTCANTERTKIIINTKWLILVNPGDIYVWGSIKMNGAKVNYQTVSPSTPFRIFYNTDIFITKK